MLHTSFTLCGRNNALLQTSRPLATTFGSIYNTIPFPFARTQLTLPRQQSRALSSSGKPQKRYNTGSAPAPASASAQSVSQYSTLNDIERQVLKAIMTGQSYESIAAAKSISVKSVEICRFRIQKKLDVDNIGLMQLAKQNPALYETSNAVITEKAIKEYMNDVKYKRPVVRDGNLRSSASASASGSVNGTSGSAASSKAASPVAATAVPTQVPVPPISHPIHPMPPPPPLLPPTPAALKKWDTAPRSPPTAPATTGSTTTVWPAAPKQFQHKVDYTLSHPSMPLKTLYSDTTATATATTAGTSASVSGGGSAGKDTFYTFADATAHVRSLANELVSRAPKMSAMMLSNIFYSLGQLRSSSNSDNVAWTKEQRDRQGELHLALMKDHMHPTLLHLLAYVLRQIKTSTASAGNIATASPNNNKKLVTTYKDGKKTVYIKEAQRNPMTCIQHVCHGMSVAGVRWQDLGHLGQGLLDIISNPVILQGTRKWDLDHALNTLGQMGLSWYQLSATQRENISEAYLQILQKESKTGVSSPANTSASTKLQAYTKGNSVPHTEVDVDNREKQPRVENDTAAAAAAAAAASTSTSTSTSTQLQHSLDIKNGGIYGTLLGLNSLGLSLREEEMPEVLFDSIYRQILVEIPNMSGRKLVQIVDIIAQMSNRGMHKLPLNVQQAVLTRLEAVHQDLPVSKTSQSLGCLDLLRALGQVTSNIWAESSASSINNPQKQMLLAIATKCISFPANTSKEKFSQFKRGRHLAHTTQALARFGVKIDFTFDAKSHSDSNADITSSEISFFLQCLDPLVMDAKSLPTALMSVAKLADTYGGRDQVRSKDSVIGVAMHRAANQKLELFLNALFPQVILNIESDSYNQHNIANVLWALGTLGRPWRDLPSKLQQTIIFKLAHEYTNKDVRNSVHAEQGMSDVDEANDDTTGKEFGGFPVSAFGYPAPRFERDRESESRSSNSDKAAAQEAAPATSLLGKISTNSLDSSMGAVSSFRELLYPNIAELSQMSLYNWFGALVKAKIPYSEIPPQFSASLLVALTDDLPNQGGATVVQMTEYLSRLNLRVKTSSEESLVPGVHVPHFLAAALLSQLSKRLHTTDSSYLLRALSALSGMHGAPLAHDMHLVECGDVNYALSTTVCSSTTRAVDNHFALLQHAHEYKALSASKINESSLNTYKNAFKKVIPAGVYTPSQLLELVAAIQKLTFYLPSKLQAQEVGEMHSAILRTLAPDSLTDVQLLQMLSPPTAHEDISPAAKLLQTVSFLQYIGMTQEDCVIVLKNLDVYDCFKSLNPAFDYENTRVRSPAHEMCSLQAHSMFALERAELYSRVLRIAGLAL